MEPTHEILDGTARLYLGDCVEVMRGLPECSVDTVLCDPPYELGFMGKSWDASGVAYQTETWREALRVAKPGALLLAFGGSRTYHRMACAVEDAGWEIRDQIMWVYGSGFPKSLDISKAIDKAKGAERESRVNERWAEKYPNGPGGNLSGDGRSAHFSQAKRITQPLLTSDPATDLARLWSGYGTALKPAHEPIVVAMKPLDGTFAENAERWGVAGLNVDGGRIQTSESLNGGAYAEHGGRSESQSLHAGSGMNVPGATTGRDFVQPSGRFPANLIHDGSEEVEAGFPETGISQGGSRGAGGQHGAYSEIGPQPHVKPGFGDTGSASRFFMSCPYGKMDACDPANTAETSSSQPSEPGDSAPSDAATSGNHAATPSSGSPAPSTSATPSGSSERGASDTPTTPSSDARCSHGSRPERPTPAPSPASDAGQATQTDTTTTTAGPSTSAGSAGPATSPSTPRSEAHGGADSEHRRLIYCAKASRSEREAGCEGLEQRPAGVKNDSGRGYSESDPYREIKRSNSHPTVKPLALMRYLAKLTRTPTGGVVLDPFMGSGSTGAACALEGRQFIGIEREPEYMEIARRRIAHWAGQPVVEEEPEQVQSKPNPQSSIMDFLEA